MEYCFPQRRGCGRPFLLCPPCFPSLPSDCPLCGGGENYEIVFYAPFTPVKRDRQTNAPLAGASYALYQNGIRTAEAASDASGRLGFANLAPGSYELRETSAPAGYQPDDNVYAVKVDKRGNVTVDGLPADRFALYDAANDAFAFSKTDAETGAPLAGAQFRLSDGRTTASDAAGLVNFGALAAGNYTMTETAAPAGYALNPAVYDIFVAANGDVSVNGIPLSEFSVADTPLPLSPVPALEPVSAGDTAVIGRGVPGATIRMTLPDGTRVATTVNADGIWAAAVPAGVVLRAGEILYADQTVEGSPPSKEVSAVVQANA